MEGSYYVNFSDSTPSPWSLKPVNNHSLGRKSTQQFRGQLWNEKTHHQDTFLSTSVKELKKTLDFFFCLVCKGVHSLFVQLLSEIVVDTRVLNLMATSYAD